MVHISARLDLRSVRFACTPTDSISIAAIAARAAASFSNFQHEIRLIAAASVHNEAHFCADVIQSRPDFALEPVLFGDKTTSIGDLEKVETNSSEDHLSSAAGQLADETAKTAFQLVWNSIRSLGRGAWEKSRVHTAMTTYATRYIERNAQVKILGMSQPAPLQSIYTSVRVIPPRYRHQYETTDGLERRYRERGERRLSVHQSKREVGIGVANREKFLNVLGPPGAGKSTFLKKIGLEALRPRRQSGSDTVLSSGEGPASDWSEYRHECVPIFLELRRLNQSPVNLLQVIALEFQTCGFPNPIRFVEEMLKKGRLLVLLDGLDEVPVKLIDETVMHIQDFTDKFHKSRFITSCRTAFYRTFFKRFTDVELVEFDRKQIRTFAHNWFSSNVDRESRTADKFLDDLFRLEHGATLELARTPLLLTFLCLVYGFSQSFPANRSGLYRRALYIFLEEWAAEKRVHGERIYEGLHTELEIELLAEIAASALADDRIFFEEDYALRRITSFMGATLGAPETISGRQILDAIEIQQGLLIQRAIGVYSFSHLTIQEYLAAHYYHSSSRVSELVDEHLFNERWREVFLMYAGIANADRLIVLMMQKMIKFVEEEEILFKLVSWTGKVTRQAPSAVESAARRIYVLSLPLRFKRYDYSAAARMETPADDLITSLDSPLASSHQTPKILTTKSTLPFLNRLEDLALIKYSLKGARIAAGKIRPDRPISELITGSRHKFYRQFADLLYRSLKLDRDIQVTRRNVQPINKYLAGCQLLVECKDVALRVSQETWERVCESIASNS